MAQSVVRPIMRDMFDAFQPWVLGTYGDSAKTKTITARKYARILRTLQGHEANSADNSKFRFWVKAKGFRVGPPPGQPPPKQPRFNPVSRMTRLAEPELYVPTGTEKDQYKKVAVVENFFDIIYSVHVDMEGRAGKHAGQKRTYRAKESSMSHPAAKRRAKENLGTPEPESMEDDYQGRNGDLRLDEAEEEGWPPYLKSKLREESPQETASMADETSSSGNKEDEDDEEEDDKLDGPSQDPERLKAFNMFVRLFVDENLDRMVPISKQPKEKIQAIIDSCTRQFPEFGERARKRIRTYLKSCRRTKRSRDQNGASLETARPTPAHLTSVQAEQILAQACENESHNAKRMRLGLEPVSQPMPVSANERPAPIDHFAKAETSTTDSKDAATSKSSFRPSGAPPTFQRPPFQPYSLMSTNGPTDLSMKSSKPLLNHKLNQAEMAAVRQLITGYRESAAFLLRSADELEQLLMQQQP
ncbi:nucleolar protein 4-like isoform X4 [Neocloeon triangulifer]|uniref:nucleolar protein 4-like isoform X4 n=1 Tax=Neocloeon triangulifer TaxID=2078957 RepID=UPI00286EEA00|nr:nucleolar protein 4-like isoform X4 [Neocloeon triangulifer]